jgi:hypothetical protein
MADQRATHRGLKGPFSGRLMDRIGVLNADNAETSMVFGAGLPDLLSPARMTGPRLYQPF